MKYLGKWRAQVTRNDDPEKLGRIKARVFDILADDNNQPLETDWALPAWTSHRHDIPPVGAGVWIEFQAPAEAPHNAIWSGMYPSYPSGISEVANVAQQPLAGNAPYARGALTVTTEDLTSLTKETDPEKQPAALKSETFVEPESLQATVYPHNQVLQTPGKITEEYDDTPGARRYHRQIGNHYVEETDSGTELRRCTLKMEFIIENEHKLVNGQQTTVVGGTARHDYEDDLAVSVLGSLFTKTGPVRAKLSSLDITIDRDGEAGTLVFSLGKLDLAAAGEAALQGLRTTIIGTEEASVTSKTVYVTGTDNASSSIVAKGAGGIVLESESGVTVRNLPVPARTPDPVLVMSQADFTNLISFLKTHTHPISPAGTGQPTEASLLLTLPTARLSTALKAE